MIDRPATPPDTGQPGPTARRHILFDDGIFWVPQRLAMALGSTDRAAIIQALHWYLVNFGHHRAGDEPDDRPWILASREDWAAELPVYHHDYLAQIFADFEKLECVETRPDPKRRGKWYTLNYDKLRELTDATAEPPEVVGRPILDRLRRQRQRGPVKTSAPAPTQPPEGARITSAPVQTKPPDQRAQNLRASAENSSAPATSYRTFETERPRETATTPAAAAGVLTDEQREAAELMAAIGFPPADARWLAREHDATRERVHRLADEARRRLDAGRLETTIRGYIVAGLRRRDDVAQPRAAHVKRVLEARPAVPPPAVPREPTDDELKAQADAEVAAAAAAVATLPDDARQALAEDVLPSCGDVVAALFRKHGRHRLVTLAMADRLRRGDWRPPVREGAAS